MNNGTPLKAASKTSRAAVSKADRDKATKVALRVKRTGLKVAKLKSLIDQKHSYAAFHRLAPAEQVAVVRQGVQARWVGEVASDLRMDQERLIRSMGVGRSTVMRRAAKQQRLSPAASDRVVGVTQLVAEAQRMMDESGSDPTFDVAAWVGRWIQSPVPALGNHRPEEYLDTAVGQQQVLQVLRQMQTGAYV